MKRIFDSIISFISIFIFLPLFLIIASTIKLTTRGPILFKQRRIGKNNKEFYIYKFRTMKIETPNTATHLLKNSETFITPIGEFLRKTSLDELPQLFNIVKGEMSLVGPRPALYNQYDLIKLRTLLGINKLTPGLTGWAQINGRDDISIDVKVSLDEEYKNRKGFLLDFKIILYTILKVLRCENVK